MSHTHSARTANGAASCLRVDSRRPPTNLTCAYVGNTKLLRESPAVVGKLDAVKPVLAELALPSLPLQQVPDDDVSRLLARCVDSGPSS